MTHSDPGGSKGSDTDAERRDADRDGSLRALPPAAQRTLDEIANALGVTTALLGRGAPLETRHGRDGAGLAEAAALLQAFIRISDPALRRRCLAVVQDAAEGRDCA